MVQVNPENWFGHAPEAVTVMVAVALCCQRAEAEAPPMPSSTVRMKAPTARPAPGTFRIRAIYCAPAAALSRERVLRTDLYTVMAP